MNKEIDISQVTLETERLLLRPWKEADLEDFHEYARVDGVGQMAGWMPHGSMEESKMILDHFIEGKKTFAIELAGKVIGSVGVNGTMKRISRNWRNSRAEPLGMCCPRTTGAEVSCPRL